MTNDNATGTGWKFVLLTYVIALVLFFFPCLWLTEIREIDGDAWWYLPLRILLVLVAVYAAYKVFVQRDDNDPNGWRVALCALALCYAIVTTAPAAQRRQDNEDKITTGKITILRGGEFSITKVNPKTKYVSYWLPDSVGEMHEVTEEEWRNRNYGTSEIRREDIIEPTAKPTE